MADARGHVGDAAAALVARVDRDAEEADAAVVEEMPLREDVVDRGPANRVLGAAVEAEDDVPPGGHVHDEARVARRAL